MYLAGRGFTYVIRCMIQIQTIPRANRNKRTNGADTTELHPFLAQATCHQISSSTPSNSIRLSLPTGLKLPFPDLLTGMYFSARILSIEHPGSVHLEAWMRWLSWGFCDMFGEQRPFGVIAIALVPVSIIRTFQKVMSEGKRGLAQTMMRWRVCKLELDTSNS